ncbi:MAG: CBO0543 family protein [Bacillota bacterium]
METQTIFMYIAIFILALVVYKVPKKMKLYEIYATSLFAIVLGLLVDTVLAVKYKLYVLDKPGIQIHALIGQVILYSTASIITLNFFPFDKQVKWKVVYIFGLTLLTVAFEFLSFTYGFIKYNEWKFWYSALCYPFLIFFLVLHYEFFKWLVKRTL